MREDSRSGRGKVVSMAEYIGCRNCSSPDCRGCNVYTLATMLNTGKFDCLMNGNRCVDRFADVAPVVPELRPVVRLLHKEYERAKKNPVVRNPMAFALYQTWKAVDDCENGR